MNKRLNVMAMSAFIACLISFSSAFADIYKCTDKTGRVKYSDVPCMSDETSEIVHHETNVKPVPGDDIIDTAAGSSRKEPADRPISSPVTDSRKFSKKKVAPVARQKECPAQSKINQAQYSGRPASIQDFTRTLEQIPTLILLAVFLTPPLLAWIFSLIHKPGQGDLAPWRYIYAGLVYLVCIPGIFSCVLTGYSMFFIRQNLLSVNIFVYFVPIISMIATLVIIGRNATWEKLPGVDRLTALMVVLVISFSVALFIQKTRIWIFFGGRFSTLVIIALISFVILKWSLYKLFRKKGP